MLWYRILTLEMRLKEIVSSSKRQPFEFNGLSKADHGARSGRKSRVGSDTAKAWAYCEASTGTTVNHIEPHIDHKFISSEFEIVSVKIFVFEDSLFLKFDWMKA